MSILEKVKTQIKSNRKIVVSSAIFLLVIFFITGSGFLSSFLLFLLPTVAVYYKIGHIPFFRYSFYSLLLMPLVVFAGATSIVENLAILIVILLVTASVSLIYGEKVGIDG